MTVKEVGFIKTRFIYTNFVHKRVVVVQVRTSQEAVVAKLEIVCTVAFPLLRGLSSKKPSQSLTWSITTFAAPLASKFLPKTSTKSPSGSACD
jgi:hypothetical protein